MNTTISQDAMWAVDEAVARMEERAKKLSPEEILAHCQTSKRNLEGKCPKYITKEHFLTALDIVEQKALALIAHKKAIAEGDARAEILELLGWNPFK